MADRESFLPPIPETVVCEIALQRGRFYAAPAGTRLTDHPDNWKPIDSLEELREMLTGALS